MKIKLVCFGKIKDKQMSLLIERFKSKINHFISFEIIELSEEKISNEQEKGLVEKALELEALKLEKYFQNSTNVFLDITGKQLDSLELASYVNRKMNLSKDIHFYIGSSHGFAKSLKEKKCESISFSNLTFNHQLFRLMFCEQLYRVFCILNNIKYHK